MRLFGLCVAATIVGGPAFAGPIDASVLRGSAVPPYAGEPAYAGEPVPMPPRFAPVSPIYRRWQGVYFGGHVGMAGAGLDFGRSTAGLIDYILRNDVVGTHVADWTTLSKMDTTKQVYGGFVGYNAQWDGDVVIGVEANYNRAGSGGLYGAASDSMTRIFNDDAQAPAQHHYFYTATVASSASARITDYATARARAGAVFDRFLPYAFVGAAIARVDIVRSATVSYTRQDIPDLVAPPEGPIPPQPTFQFGPQTRTEQKMGAFAYGFTGGLGVDIALLPNVFVRAEAEYVQLFPVQDFKIHLATGRVGVGVKF